MGAGLDPRCGERTRQRRWDDRGSSLVSSSIAVTAFLVMLLFVVQLLVGLYGRSVVTGAAYDGAHAVAGARVDHGDADAVAGARSAAEARMRQQLGAIGTGATFDWSASDVDTVVLRVQADNPRFAFPGFGGPLATDHIDRTVHVRIEQVA